MAVGVKYQLNWRCWKKLKFSLQLKFELLSPLSVNWYFNCFHLLLLNRQFYGFQFLCINWCFSCLHLFRFNWYFSFQSLHLDRHFKPFQVSKNSHFHFFSTFLLSKRKSSLLLNSCQTLLSSMAGSMTALLRDFLQNAELQLGCLQTNAAFVDVSQSLMPGDLM